MERSFVPLGLILSVTSAFAGGESGKKPRLR